MRPTLDQGFYWLNGRGDLGIYSDVKDYIGQLVWFVKVTKAGMVQVRGYDGKLVSVPRRNLERR